MGNISHHEPGTRPMREDLAAIYRQLRDFSDAMCALSDHWPSARPVPLWWDENRQVLATEAALGTYRAIYGNDLIRGSWHLWKLFRRRWRGDLSGSSREPLRIDAPLPVDAVAIAQKTRYVLTVVSEQEKCVVKIFAKERKGRFSSELKAWRLAQAAGIGHRVPDLLSSGESVNGFCWLVWRLVRNSGFFYPSLFGDWLWRRHLVKEILPDLQRFYEQSGVEVLSGAEWLHTLRTKIAEHPRSAMLQEFATLVEDAQRSNGDDRVPFAVVHGDLRPHNVHWYRGRWWLIDWSMSARAPVTIDLFWPDVRRALGNEVFGAWLRGNTSLNALPRGFRGPLDMYAEWQASWVGIRPGEAALRFQVLATLLHRLSHVPGPTPLSIKTVNVLRLRAS